MIRSEVIISLIISFNSFIMKESIYHVKDSLLTWILISIGSPSGVVRLKLIIATTTALRFNFFLLTFRLL